MCCRLLFCRSTSDSCYGLLCAFARHAMMSSTRGLAQTVPTPVYSHAHPLLCSVPNREKGRDRVAEEQLGDRTVGLQKSEQILPVGTVLTAVGELRSVIDHPDAFRVRWPLLLASISGHAQRTSTQLCCHS